MDSLQALVQLDRLHANGKFVADFEPDSDNWEAASS